jgi:hypothetical protein
MSQSKYFFRPASVPLVYYKSPCYFFTDVDYLVFTNEVVTDFAAFRPSV